MKTIFKGRLYDIEKSEKICNVGFSGYSVWKTSKGALFLFNDITMRVSSADQKTNKRYFRAGKSRKIH